MASNPNGKELHMTSIHDVAATVKQGPLHKRTTQPRVNAEPQAPSETPARIGQHARRDNASDKQLTFIRDLIVDLAPSWTQEQANAVDRQVKQGLTKTQASDWIERMVEARKRLRDEQARAKRQQRTTSSYVVPAGMYRMADGTIVRVYFGQTNAVMLAKKLVDTGQPHPEDAHVHMHDWEYMGKASRFITPDTQRLTIEEAAEFGRMSGSCAVCARRLDVPESVERGIGPVCYSRLETGNWLTEKQQQRLAAAEGE